MFYFFCHQEASDDHIITLKQDPDTENEEAEALQDTSVVNPDDQLVNLDDEALSSFVSPDQVMGKTL